MSKLETVVRPFQTGDVFNARVLAPLQPPVSKPAPVVLEWGGPIQLISKAIGIRDLNTGGKHWSEVSRSTKTVRVTNPTDPEQFVDVEKILQMHFQDEKGVDHFMKLSN